MRFKTEAKLADHLTNVHDIGAPDPAPPPADQQPTTTTNEADDDNPF